MKNSLLTNDKEKQKNRTNTNEKNLWRKLLVDAPKVLLLMKKKSLMKKKNLWRKLLVDAPKVLLLMLLKIILWPCYEAKPMRF
jgi:hypothetical protein